MAEPFKSLDLVGDSDELADAVDDILKGGQYEAALLEEVGSCMPDSFVDEVLARVDKSELIANLLGSRGIGLLRRKVRGCDSANIRMLVDTIVTAAKCDDKVGPVGSFAYAYGMRDRMFKQSGYTILNHTYPCPYSLWAFSGEVDLDSARSVRLTTLSFSEDRMHKTVGSSGKNLYDSSLHHIGYKGYRSVAATVQSELRVALYNPVRRKIASGLAAFRWAESHGVHYEPLLDLFLHSWAGHVDIRVLGTPGKHAEISAKRLSLRHSKVNHLVLAYPNTQGAVRVDARAVTRAQAGAHHMHDIMAAITTLRCAGLLEASLQLRRGVKSFAYGFAFKPEAMAVQKVPDGPPLPSNLDKIFKVKPFVDIESPLRDAARVATSAEGMRKVLAEYMRAGTRAANAMFEAAVENEELTEDVAEHAGDEVLKVRAARTEMKYSDFALSRNFIEREASSKLDLAGVVAADQSRAPPTVSVQAMALESTKALDYVGDSFLDTRAISLALEHSVVAQEIITARRSESIEDLMEAESWAESKDYVMLSRSDVTMIIRDVDMVRAAVNLAEALARSLRRMGMPGFRVAGDLDDAQHTVMSFVHRASSVSGYLAALARSIQKLKASSSEEYSSISVSADSAKPTFITRVIRAQWLLAAARYEQRANSSVSRGDYSVGLLNARTGFLRVAQRALKPTGNLSARAMWAAIADKAIESAVANLKNDDIRNEYLTTLSDNGLDDNDELESDDECISAVTSICDTAHNFGGTISTEELTLGAREVMGWVRADTAGIHRSVRFRPTRLRTSMVAPRSPEPEPTQLSDILADLDLGSTTALEARPSEAQEEAPEEAPEVVDALELKLQGIIAKGGNIGGDDDYKPVVGDASPEVVMQWLFDEHWPDIVALGYTRNPHAAWETVSATKQTYTRWLAELEEHIDFGDFDDSVDTMFTTPAWAEEGDDWMVE